MISKQDYQRLQEISQEMNSIMKRNNLNEIQIQTQQDIREDDTYKTTIYTREYDEDNRQEFCYGSLKYDSKEEIIHDYLWDYEKFTKGGW